MPVLLVLVPVSAAQDTEKRLDELTKQNEELASRLEEVEASLAEHDTEYLFGLGGQYGSLSLGFQIFGDVGAGISDDDEEHPAFALGSVDFVVNAQMGERFSVLSETVLEIDDEDEKTNIGQERLWGKWTFSDLLYAKLGTEHSPISRWNQLYHHGRWLETTIFRPALAGFEGEDGILPMHRTGLELGGSHFFGTDQLEYFATVSNGRGVSPEDKQRNSDQNDSKAIDMGLAYVPAGIPELRVGASLTYDTIPPDPSSASPDRSSSMRELISVANAEFKGAVLVRSEFAWIEHDSRATSSSFVSNSGYFQAELPMGSWTPYTRFDYRDMEEGDPFYSPLDRDLDLWGQTLGLRFEPTENVAIKMEVVFGQEDTRTSGVSEEEDLLALGFQLSWWL